MVTKGKIGHCYGNTRAEEHCSCSTITCEEKSAILNTYVSADRTMERTTFSVNKFHETICGHLRVGAMLN